MVGDVLTVLPSLPVLVIRKFWGQTRFKNLARGTCPAMAAAPSFRMTGEGVTAKAPAMTTDAADGDASANNSGAGVDTRDASTEETARAARRGDKGALSRVFFFRGRPERV